MKSILFLLFLLTGGSLFAQTFDYQPSQSKIPSKKEFKERMEENLLADIEGLKGRNGGEIAGIYEGRSEYLTFMALEEDEYIFRTPMNAYIDSIFSRIVRANDFNPNRVQVFISRDMVPNASCYGEGTVVINIGLIRRLENESQVAFVLAHELAHYAKDHVNISIVNFVENKNSRETQKEIKKISKQKYKRNQAGMDLLMGFEYDNSRYSRTMESEADEIAVEYMKKAGYDSRQAVRALELLDEIDSDKYTEEIVFHKEFNRPQYPFKNEWLEADNPLAAFFEKDQGMEEIFDNVDLDSLKTHPDCKVRMEFIQDKVEEGQLYIFGEAAHQQAVAQADFDYVLSAYHYKNYGYAIYQSLQLQKIYPNHPFLMGIIGACMGEMAMAIDDHELGKILPQSSPAFTDNYSQLLDLLNNLSEEEMTEVGYNYVRIFAKEAAENEALAYGLALTSRLKEKSAEKTRYKSIYQRTFPSGYFRTQVAKT